MTGYPLLCLLLAFVACSSPSRTQQGPAAAARDARAIPRGAGPSDVYRLFGERQARLQSELQLAAERLRPLEVDGREAELERARNDVLETMDFESLAQFRSQAQIRELAALSAAERRAVLAMSLSPALAPSRIEIQDEVVTEGRALLRVRGYFDEAFTGEPGWATGTVSLVLEGGGWKVEEETFGPPRSDEDDAPSGRFQVSGEEDAGGETITVTQPLWESVGGGWSFGLRNDATRLVIRFANIPESLAPGEYPLTHKTPVSGDADWNTLRLPLSVLLAERSADIGYVRTWDEHVTGTLTIEAFADGMLAGSFEFTASALAGRPVTVRGSFANVRLP